LEKALINKDKYALSMKLLVDKEGKKVGKTTGNALFLDSTPENFYAGIMSFPDEVIYLGFELLTELSLEGLEEKIKVNPMSEKKRLAYEIVKLLWGEESAKSGQTAFENSFQKGEASYNTEIPLKENLLQTIAPFTSLASISEAKRLVSQNAVEVNGVIVSDAKMKLATGDQIKIGKKTFGTIK
jgi:tyrosyl-tRNA synthetase